MKLEMTINNIKSIKTLHISLPLEKGLYAITGQNGSGKSTVITCASSAYFNMRMNDYFGKTPDDASILFELNGAKKEWRKVDRYSDGGKVWNSSFQGSFQLKGFYEGSIIFGNRFRNTKYDLLMKLDRIDDSKLQLTSDFIRKNLGKILHNNENFYDKILRLNNKDAGNIVKFDGDIFYYQK
jgi:energy-coupling factor transporter ATP-binding protein EcfA2